MAPPELAGGYDFLALLARLMETDLDPLWQPEVPAEAMRELYAANAAHHARSGWADIYDLGLVSEMPPGSERILFHERVHYWQQASTPALQLKFMTHLDELSLRVAELGGAERWVCSSRPPGALRTPPERAAAAEEMRVKAGSAQADWHAGPFSPRDIVGQSLNTIDDDTHMPLLMLPHSESETTRLPAYGAMMRFDGSERVSCVPFTALYLLESAAYVSECLFAGEPPPPRRLLKDEQDDLYSGAWEFWRRVHGDRYADGVSLALGFLAAVDFAVVAHGLQIEADAETMAELTSIPYRFGKLAFRTRDFPPLELDGREAADAVADFQDSVCRWTGLPGQRETLIPLAAALTRMLLMSVSRDLDETSLPTFEALFGQPLDQAGESLEPAWALIRAAASDGAPPIGQDCVGEMLNATVYRLHHPGVLAVPHAYAPQLTAALPLPAALHRGKLLLEDATWRPDLRDGPYPSEAGRLLTDVVGLTAVKPLLDGVARCGFVADGLRCSYLGWGLGCPQRGLSSDEQVLRERSGLDDFCHWMHRAVLLGVAPGGAQHKWMARMRERAARAAPP